MPLLVPPRVGLADGEELATFDISEGFVVVNMGEFVEHGEPGAAQIDGVDTVSLEVEADEQRLVLEGEAAAGDVGVGPHLDCGQLDACGGKLAEGPLHVFDAAFI